MKEELSVKFAAQEFAHHLTIQQLHKEYQDELDGTNHRQPVAVIVDGDLTAKWVRESNG